MLDINALYHNLPNPLNLVLLAEDAAKETQPPKDIVSHEPPTVDVTKEPEVSEPLRTVASTTPTIVEP